MTTPTIPTSYNFGASLQSIAAPFKSVFQAPAGGYPTPSILSGMSTPKPAVPTALASNFSTQPTVPNMSMASSSPAVPNMSFANPKPTVPNMSVAPTTPNMSVAPKAGGTYSVMAGDTLSTIAAKNGMSLSQLIAQNPQYVSNPNAVKVGASINLGGGTPTVPTVQTGPAPSKSAIQVTPSGTVVNGHTGGVVAGQSTTTPTVPTLPDAGTPQMPMAPADPLANNPLYTSPEYEAAVKAYQGLQAPTAEETQNATDLANLEASYRKAYTNTEGQPIPLEFITGENRRLQESATDLAAPLQAKATLLQARRTAALDSAKFGVDTAKAKVDAYRGFNTPTSVAVGSQLVNPATGTSVFGSGSSEAIGKAIAEGRLSPDMVTRYGQSAILQALQLDPGYNFITQKASVGSDSASLKTQQEYADTTSRAYSTATANLKVLNDLVSSAGLNQSDIPLVNQLTNKVKANLTDPGAVASFHTALEGLRAEYAQVLSRGGQVTDTARNSANALIPDNISPAQLAQVMTQLSAEGANAVKEANAKVKEIKDRIGSNSGSSGNSSGGSTTVQTKVGTLDLSTW